MCILTIFYQTLSDDYFHKILIIFGAEIAQNWILHFFIIKINNLNYETINNYLIKIKNNSLLTYYQVTSLQKEGLNLMKIDYINNMDFNIFFLDISMKISLNNKISIFPYITLVID